MTAFLHCKSRLAKTKVFHPSFETSNNNKQRKETETSSGISIIGLNDGVPGDQKTAIYKVSIQTVWKSDLPMENLTPSIRFFLLIDPGKITSSEFYYNLKGRFGERDAFNTVMLYTILANHFVCR